MNENFKAVIDGSAIGMLIAAWIGWLQPIATLFTIAWLGLRIWETETVKKWTGRTSAGS